jgi:hypothetical protein
VSSVRTVNTAQITYNSSYSTVGFAVAIVSGWHELRSSEFQ